MGGTRLKVWGLKNCDTCRKALKWLDENGVAYDFADVRKDGLTEADIKRWAKAVGVEVLLNRRGTTWRKLSDADKQAAETDAGAIAVMTANPSAIKRPIFDDGKRVLVGFSAEVQAALS